MARFGHSGPVCHVSWGLGTKSRGPPGSPGSSLKTGPAGESSVRPAGLRRLHIRETALNYTHQPVEVGDSEWMSGAVCRRNPLPREALRAQAGSSRRRVACHVNVKNEPAQPDVSSLVRPAARFEGKMLLRVVSPRASAHRLCGQAALPLTSCVTSTYREPDSVLVYPTYSSQHAINK